ILDSKLLLEAIIIQVIIFSVGWRRNPILGDDFEERIRMLVSFAEPYENTVGRGVDGLHHVNLLVPLDSVLLVASMLEGSPQVTLPADPRARQDSFSAEAE